MAGGSFGLYDIRAELHSVGQLRSPPNVRAMNRSPVRTSLVAVDEVQVRHLLAVLQVFVGDLLVLLQSVHHLGTRTGASNLGA